MASRRTTIGPRSLKSSSTDTRSSKGGNVTNKANNSGNEKKSVKSSGTVVKSRYLQSAEKTSLSKSDSSNNESMAPPPRPASPKPRPKVGTPPRRFLQSTFTDGHSLCPDFDISAIKEKTVLENIAETERSSELDKREVEQQTLLLAYLTAKMEHNTAKLRAEAEARLLQVMEEEESLRLEVSEKKRQYELKEKNRVLSELLDLQNAALAPVAEAASRFTKEYQSFAAAVDATRHELPVKNFYMDGEPSHFLDKAQCSLRESENLLGQCTHGNTEDKCSSLDSLKNMKTTSKEMSHQLSGAFSELLELSSLIGRHTIQLQQASEEVQLGPALTHRLYCPKT